MNDKPRPDQLWRQAGQEFSNCPAARSARYRDLMREYGHLVSPRDAVIEAAKTALLRRYGGRGDPAREHNARTIGETIADDVVAVFFPVSSGTATEETE